MTAILRLSFISIIRQLALDSDLPLHFYKHGRREEVLQALESYERSRSAKEPACRQLRPQSVRIDGGEVSSLCPSLRLDAGRLNNWPPLLDFSLLQRAKGLKRLLGARRDLLCKVSQPCPHHRIGQGLNNSHLVWR